MIKAVIFDMFETLITHFESPLYFGEQMALDAGIPEKDFAAVWDPTGEDRTLGKMTFEEALERTLRENGRYTRELFEEIRSKRIETKKECFRRVHPDVMPLLSAIKVRGRSIGLISNCFSEEVPVIKESVLYPFFDAACLSYEEGIMKPDRETFTRCLDRLGAEPHECIYVGDGGAYELESAREIGMPTYQAVWYLHDYLDQVCGRKDDFIQLESPLDLLDYIQ